MKQALIDIGSNSMRLSLYETDGENFKILFREKIMAGLAGYVDKGVMSQEGIRCACKGLMEFKMTLKSLDIDEANVFATASLRNIRNTSEATCVIHDYTGFDVEVISGEDESLYGYWGAMNALSAKSGVFTDIGGASTEIVVFEDGVVKKNASFEVGSLNLYRKCVKNILPKSGSLVKIQKTIVSEIDEKIRFSLERHSDLVCVGGTARAALKLAIRFCKLDENVKKISFTQLSELCAFLQNGDRDSADLILKLVPDRIHTIIPGLLILKHICTLFQCEHIIVSDYGVREGYLCQKILRS